MSIYAIHEKGFFSDTITIDNDGFSGENRITRGSKIRKDKQNTIMYFNSSGNVGYGQSLVLLENTFKELIINHVETDVRLPSGYKISRVDKPTEYGIFADWIDKLHTSGALYFRVGTRNGVYTAKFAKVGTDKPAKSHFIACHILPLVRTEPVFCGGGKGHAYFAYQFLDRQYIGDVADFIDTYKDRYITQEIQEKLNQIDDESLTMTVGALLHTCRQGGTVVGGNIEFFPYTDLNDLPSSEDLCSAKESLCLEQ